MAPVIAPRAGSIGVVTHAHSPDHHAKSAPMPAPITNPPTKPSRVLPGLSHGISFVRPIAMPVKYAPMSVDFTVRIAPASTAGPCARSRAIQNAHGSPAYAHDSSTPATVDDAPAADRRCMRAKAISVMSATGTASTAPAALVGMVAPLPRNHIEPAPSIAASMQGHSCTADPARESIPAISRARSGATMSAHIASSTMPRGAKGACSPSPAPTMVVDAVSSSQTSPMSIRISRGPVMSRCQSMGGC